MISLNISLHSEAGINALRELPGLAELAASLLFLNLLDGLLEPFHEARRALLHLILGVALKLGEESAEADQLFLCRVHRRRQEEVDVARERPGLLVDAVFNASEEFVCEALAKLSLRVLAEATAHLLNVLETHLVRFLEDSHEGLMLGLLVWVSGRAVDFCTANHIRLVELGQHGKALLLLVLWNALGGKNLAHHSVTHLSVDLCSLNL